MTGAAEICAAEGDAERRQAYASALAEIDPDDLGSIAKLRSTFLLSGDAPGGCRLLMPAGPHRTEPVKPVTRIRKSARRQGEPKPRYSWLWTLIAGLIATKLLLRWFFTNS